MRTVVIVGPVAVTTEYWEEEQADGTRETGCRVELRRVADTAPPAPPPVPRRDAVHWTVGDHLWRADLFSTVSLGRPFDAAHYHPTFEGLVPCERVFDPSIEPDPYAWIERRLQDLPGMLAEAGHPELVAEVDRSTLAQAMPAILAGIRMSLDYRAPHAAPDD
jgi:hypothetical protein